jgi:mannose-6-phosphate isomerase
MLKPFFMEPYFNEKDWGGTRLASVYGKAIPSAHTGESWEVSAHPMGQSACEGRTLRQLMEDYGDALMGTGVKGEFPLLIKLIDAREWLSVQVHPDDEYARRVEGDPYGKTEAWVVLDCDPGAELIFGIDCGVETLRGEMERGYLERHLRKVAVQPGDVLYIPAGTVHAIGANMLIYEVQQSSDRTYRLYAWGRDAQLHKEKSLDVIDPKQGGKPMQGAKVEVEGGLREIMVLDPCFALERITATGRMPMRTDGTRFYAYTAVAPGRVSWEGGAREYKAGDSFLIPAALGAYALEGGVLYKSYFPDVAAVEKELAALHVDLNKVGGKR